MKNIKIRKVSLSEVDQLQIIGIQTFVETFAKDNREEDMKNYLDKAFSLALLNDELSNQNIEYYFSLIDEKIIGYLKVNIANSESEVKHPNTLEIERIYVLKKYHGTNVGKMLLEKAIEIATKKQVENIWLGVWEKNPRAIQFYKKNNFVEFDNHIFKLGNDHQTDILMKLLLN